MCTLVDLVAALYLPLLMAFGLAALAMVIEWELRNRR